MYEISPKLAERFKERGEKHPEKELKRLMHEHGVQWPRGTSLTYYPYLDRLVICYASSGDRRVCEEYSRNWGLLPSQVGRYQLLQGDATTVLLFDQKSGDTWQYTLSDKAPSRPYEYFRRIMSNEDEEKSK